MKRLPYALLVFCVLLLVAGMSHAADTVGSFVALKGSVTLERERQVYTPQVKDSLTLNDTVSTREASRAKMLFIDDSVLTLGENSKAIIKEYVSGREKGGKSIIAVLDGKMRAIVGKSNFEIHTPTAVAAARGTIILCEVSIVDGKQVSTFICLEGEFMVTSNYPGSEGSTVLTPGMMITVTAGDPFPAPLQIPGGDTGDLLAATEISQELSIPGPAAITLGPGVFIIEQMQMLPPYEHEPGTINTTPVTIDIIFPK
ncbi:MAG: FecR family protein [Nitrospirota bacterium]